MPFALPHVDLSAPAQDNLPSTPGINNPGTVITAAASANTKGAYSAGQLFSATNFDVYYVAIHFHNTFVAATRTDTLVDIGIGASGSEVTVLPDLLAGQAAVPAASSLAVKSYFLPLFIPMGSRVAARAQSVTASKTVSVTMHLFGGPDGLPWPVVVGADAIGVTNAAASNGTSVTPGSTGAAGTWTSVGSTTARDYKGLMVGLGGTLAVTATTSIAYHWEVGYSSTTLARFFAGANTTEMVTGMQPQLPIFQSIPSGTQLQVRGTGSGSAQAYDVALYGLY